MVSCYNSAAMYRHQQAVSSPGAQFHHGNPSVHSWYGYHPQGAQLNGTPPAASFCMQDEQQMWSNVHPHAVFPHEYQDFMSQTHNGMGMHTHPTGGPGVENTLPSPPITVSGSELSSPGVGGSISPVAPSGQSRPPPARSPFEWIKKTSYQSQPNPGKTRTKDKYRVVYTDHQRVELEKEFYYSRYITIRRKAELATSLGLSERQVKIWFQNRRAKERKQVKKRDETAPRGNLNWSDNIDERVVLTDDSSLPTL